MRISLVISSLGSGGAERVLTGMANFFQKQGHQITIITYAGELVDFYYLDPTISRTRLNLLKISTYFYESIVNFYQRISILRQAILKTKPDMVISFIDRCNLLTLLACQGTGIPIIISERTNPLYYPIGRFWNLLRRLIYRQAHYLVIQTTSLNHWAMQHTDAKHIAVIANALDENRAQAICHAKLERSQTIWSKRIITMGRFTAEKGHDLLLHAVKPLLFNNPDWGLEIIGDGPLKSTLLQLIQELGLEDKVLLHGQVSNPFGLLKGADIFVLPSRIEGFPNALLEAMAVGVACVSFDCPSGPSDLIQHGDNGLLVEVGNVTALTLAIQQCMNDDTLRLKLAEKALQVREHYAETQIMAQWEQLLVL